jgi:hypothetical protein
MTCKEYEESVCFIKEATDRFHQRTGKYPTKEEAVRAIGSGRRKYFGPPMSHWKEEWAIRRRSCERFAALELIKRINESPEKDPIEIAYQFLDAMDDMLTNSESRHTWVFAGTMETALSTIINELLA